ncbi:mucin-2 isoform X2 [Hydra vulgaris]|uniref:mucin-2 isoform X2 n=1 Tax=Hydra vulgaris TaxID=6087 RepID=UPI0032EA5248
MYLFGNIWLFVFLTQKWKTIEGTKILHPLESFESSTEFVLDGCLTPFNSGLCQTKLIETLNSDYIGKNCKKYLNEIHTRLCHQKSPTNGHQAYCELNCDRELCNSIFDESKCNNQSSAYYYENGACKHGIQLDCASHHFSSLEECKKNCISLGSHKIKRRDIQDLSCNCENGGKCVDPIAGICVCPAGYMGNKCDKFYCDDFCENGGVCAGPLTCKCPTAYSSKINPFCKQAICELNCGPGGYCGFSNDGQPLCICQKGYSGAKCDEKIISKLPVESGVCKTYIDDIINNTDNYINVFASVKEKSYCLNYINDISLNCYSDKILPRYTLENCYHFCDINRTGNVCGLVFSDSCPSSKKFAYDESLMRCVEFKYKGCLGNKNSYDSYEKCAQRYSVAGLGYSISTAVMKTCYVHDKMQYSTFDGLKYQLNTGCSYLLVHDTDSQNNFDIIINNDPKMNYNTTVKRTLDIKADNKAIHLGQKIGDLFIVRVDGNLVSLPYDGTPKIKQAGRYIMVITSDQVIVTFDGREVVEITVPESYRATKKKNSLVGLCGNFDGDHRNDFVDFSGIQRSNVKEFASVFQTNKGLCSENFTPIPFYNPTGSDIFVYENAERICSIIETEAFKPCHDVLDPEVYKLICMQEVLHCNYDLRSDCICGALSQYSRVCLKLGKEIKWRTPALCPVTCKGDMQYYDCGSACPKMCDNLMSSTKCIADCVDGCHCPPDLYFDTATDRCIPRSQCSCYKDGVRYPHGSVRNGQCEDCTCNGGAWSCSKKPCAASCHIYGDPHIKTFDGKQYDMYGQCSYVLMDHCHYGTGKKEFEIIVKNSKCSDNTIYTSCVRSLLVNLTSINTRINFDSISDGSQNSRKYPLVTVNGVETSFVITDQYQIAIIGDENVVFQYQKTKFMIHWTSENIYITVGHEFENQTCGLCGTYNQNKQDDFHTRSDSVETSVTAFTQAWIYNDNDVNQDPLKCHSSLWEISEKPCQIYATNLPYAKDSCSIINNLSGPFAACHNVVPPSFHYESCLQDACKCQNCYCSVVSQYAKLCMDKGILVHGWRDETKECSMNCPAPKINRQCNTDVSGLTLKCPATCLDISTNDTDACSIRGCVEGCFCPEGYFEDNNQECVKKEKCPCFHNNLIYQFGETRQDRCNNCTCVGGKFECTNINCEGHCEEKGLQYSDCGLTCSNFKLTKQDLRCQSGCFCRDGKVMHENGSCVEPNTQCQCKEAEQFYNMGDTSPSDCAKVCNGDRTWKQLSGVDAKPQYDCAAFGQMHYRTFDGKMYKFDGGKCQYIMMSDCKKNGQSQFCDLLQANFNVRVRNTRCIDSYEQYMCKEVTIEMRMTDGSMAEIVLLQENVDVYHHETKLSFKKGNYPQPLKNVIDGLEIFKSGLFIIVRAYKLDYTVKYDQHNRVYVIPGVKHKWSGNFAGLCGNFNGKDEDDFQKLDNLPADNALQFAKSWTDEASSCSPPIDLDTCTANPEYLPWAQKGCNIIKTGNFTTCHKAVNPEPFVESCMQETCLCKSGGDCACFCSAVSAYVQECNRHGVPIYWRREGLCKLDCCDPCGHSYGYYADNKIPQTCNKEEKKCDPKERCCKGAIVEGCGCPEGTYDDGHHCQNITKEDNILCSSSIIQHTSSTMAPSIFSSYSISSTPQKTKTPLLSSTAELLSSSAIVNSIVTSQIQSSESIHLISTSMLPPSVATETLKVQTTLQSVFSTIVESSFSTLIISSIKSSENIQSTSVTESQKVKTSFVTEPTTTVFVTSITPPVTTVVASTAVPPPASSVETVVETSAEVYKTSSYLVSVSSESTELPPPTSYIETLYSTAFVHPTTSVEVPETSSSEYTESISTSVLPETSFIFITSTYSFIEPSSSIVEISSSTEFVLPTSSIEQTIIVESSTDVTESQKVKTSFVTEPTTTVFVTSITPPVTTVVASTAVPPPASSVETVVETSAEVYKTSSYLVSVSSESTELPPPTSYIETLYSTAFVHPTTSVEVPETSSSEYTESISTSVLPETSFISITSTYSFVEPSSIVEISSSAEFVLPTSSIEQTVIVESSTDVTESQKVKTSFVTEPTTTVFVTSITPPVTTVVASTAVPPPASSVETVVETSAEVYKTSSYLVLVSSESTELPPPTSYIETLYSTAFVHPTTSVEVPETSSSEYTESISTSVLPETSFISITSTYSFVEPSSIVEISSSAEFVLPTSSIEQTVIVESSTDVTESQKVKTSFVTEPTTTVFVTSITPPVTTVVASTAVPPPASSVETVVETSAEVYKTSSYLVSVSSESTELPPPTSYIETLYSTAFVHPTTSVEVPETSSSEYTESISTSVLPETSFISITSTYSFVEPSSIVEISSSAEFVLPTSSIEQTVIVESSTDVTESQKVKTSFVTEPTTTVFVTSITPPVTTVVASTAVPPPASSVETVVETSAEVYKTSSYLVLVSSESTELPPPTSYIETLYSTAFVHPTTSVEVPETSSSEYTESILTSVLPETSFISITSTYSFVEPSSIVEISSSAEFVLPTSSIEQTVIVESSTDVTESQKVKTSFVTEPTTTVFVTSITPPVTTVVASTAVPPPASSVETVVETSAEVYKTSSYLVSVSSESTELPPPTSYIETLYSTAFVHPTTSVEVPETSSSEYTESISTSVLPETSFISITSTYSFVEPSSIVEISSSAEFVLPTSSIEQTVIVESSTDVTESQKVKTSFVTEPTTTVFVTSITPPVTTVVASTAVPPPASSVETVVETSAEVYKTSSYLVSVSSESTELPPPTSYIETLYSTAFVHPTTSVEVPETSSSEYTESISTSVLPETSFISITSTYSFVEPSSIVEISSSAEFVLPTSSIEQTVIVESSTDVTESQKVKTSFVTEPTTTVFVTSITPPVTTVVASTAVPPPASSVETVVETSAEVYKTSSYLVSVSSESTELPPPTSYIETLYSTAFVHPTTSVEVPETSSSEYTESISTSVLPETSFIFITSTYSFIEPSSSIVEISSSTEFVLPTSSIEQTIIVESSTDVTESQKVKTSFVTEPTTTVFVTSITPPVTTVVASTAVPPPASSVETVVETSAEVYKTSSYLVSVSSESTELPPPTSYIETLYSTAFVHPTTSVEVPETSSSEYTESISTSVLPETSFIFITSTYSFIEPSSSIVEISSSTEFVLPTSSIEQTIIVESSTDVTESQKVKTSFVTEPTTTVFVTSITPPVTTVVASTAVPPPASSVETVVETSAEVYKTSSYLVSVSSESTELPPPTSYIETLYSTAFVHPTTSVEVPETSSSEYSESISTSVLPETSFIFITSTYSFIEPSSSIVEISSSTEFVLPTSSIEQTIIVESSTDVTESQKVKTSFVTEPTTTVFVTSITPPVTTVVASTAVPPPASSVETVVETSAEVYKTSSYLVSVSSESTELPPPTSYIETLYSTAFVHPTSSVEVPETSSSEYTESISTSVLPETSFIFITSTYSFIEPSSSIVEISSSTEFVLPTSSIEQTIIVESSTDVTESQKVKTSFVTEPTTTVFVTSITPPVTTVVASTAVPPPASSVETVVETSAEVYKTSSYLVTVSSESTELPPPTSYIETLYSTAFVHPTTSVEVPETSSSEYTESISTSVLPETSFIFITSTYSFVEPSSFIVEISSSTEFVLPTSSIEQTSESFSSTDFFTSFPSSTFVLPSPTSTFVFPSDLPLSTLPRSLLTDNIVTLSTTLSSSSFEVFKKSSSQKTLVFPTKSIPTKTTRLLQSSVLYISSAPPVTIVVASTAVPPPASSVETVVETSAEVYKTSSYLVSLSSESTELPPPTSYIETLYSTAFVHPTTSVEVPETSSSEYTESISTSVLPETSFISITSTYSFVEPSSSIVEISSSAEFVLPTSSIEQTVIVESSTDVTESQKVKTSFVTEPTTTVFVTSITPPVTTVVASTAVPPPASSVETVVETSAEVYKTSSYLVSVSSESTELPPPTSYIETLYSTAFVHPTTSVEVPETSSSEYTESISTSVLPETSFISITSTYSFVEPSSSILEISSSAEFVLPTSSIEQTVIVESSTDVTESQKVKTSFVTEPTTTVFVTSITPPVTTVVASTAVPPPASSVETVVETSAEVYKTSSYLVSVSSESTELPPPTSYIETLYSTAFVHPTTSVEVPETSSSEYTDSISTSVLPETSFISITSTYSFVEPSSSIVEISSSAEFVLPTSSIEQTVIVESSTDVTESQKVKTSFVTEPTTTVFVTSITPPVTTVVASTAVPPPASSVETVVETSAEVYKTSSYLVSVSSESTELPPPTSYIETLYSTAFVHPTTSVEVPETSSSEYTESISTSVLPETSFISITSTYSFVEPSSSIVEISSSAEFVLPTSSIEQTVIVESSTDVTESQKVKTSFVTEPTTTVFVTSITPPVTTVVASTAVPPPASSVETVVETSAEVYKTSSYLVSVSSESTELPPPTSYIETLYSTAFVHPTTSVEVPETSSSEYTESISTSVLPETSFISITSTYSFVEPSSSIVEISSSAEFVLPTSSIEQTVIVESSTDVTESQKVKTSFVTEPTTTVFVTSITPPVTTVVASTAVPPPASSVETVVETSAEVYKTSSYLVSVSSESTELPPPTSYIETLYSTAFVHPTTSVEVPETSSSEYTTVFVTSKSFSTISLGTSYISKVATSEAFSSNPGPQSTLRLFSISTFSSHFGTFSSTLKYSILPSISSISVVPTSSVFCPACFYRGSLYGVGESWQDARKCTNFTCTLVSNPCYPSNTSAQIEAKSEVCQPCPSGYISVTRPNQCCPNCIPSEKPFCDRKVFGMEKLVEEDSELGRCESTKKYLITGCGGFCDSTIKAAVGKRVFTPSCSCCQPLRVVSFNVPMVCEDGYRYTTIFHDIQSCNCSSSCHKKPDQIELIDTNEEKRTISFQKIAKLRNDGQQHQKNIIDHAFVHLKKRSH